MQNTIKKTVFALCIIIISGLIIYHSKNFFLNQPLTKNSLDAACKDEVAIQTYGKTKVESIHPGEYIELHINQTLTS